MVAELRPDILLLDLKMPGLSTTELEKWVRKYYPETITLVLTAHDRDFYLAGMMDAGASGYITKNERAENLITAIRRTARGESLFTQEQLERVRHWHETAGQKGESLTEREREILKLLSDGLNNADIAKAIGLTSKTVSYHITNILEKLEVHSRQEAAAWAHKYLPDNLE
jgi:DNA-binding NarL/FixJ family response regulator